MSNLQIELCPETGICSIIKSGEGKVDLMPDEVEALRAAQGNADQIKSQIGEVDNSFAAKLSAEDFDAIAAKLK